MRRRGRPPCCGRWGRESEAEAQGSVRGVYGAGEVNLEMGVGDDVGHGVGRREQAETPFESASCEGRCSEFAAKKGSPHHGTTPPALMTARDRVTRRLFQRRVDPLFPLYPLPLPLCLAFLRVPCLEVLKCWS